jgi:hypothetical protein
MTLVKNLRTGAIIHVDQLPRDACVSAHALSIGDASTWMYDRYEALVDEASIYFFCGDWAAKK